MDLNDLIYQRLAKCGELSAVLAEFCGMPAVFNSEVPSDQQDGWEGKSQYPRICYRVDMQVNQERASVGTLHVSIYTEKNPLVLEDIENLVRGCLKDVLMKPSDQAPFCVAWARTEPYLLEGMAVICKDILFDILEYPGQETTDPDPVMAVSCFIKELYPDAIVLGIDRIGDYTNPADRPIFYCRLEDIQKTRGYCEHSVVWFIARVAVHLLYPDAAVRLKMIAAINQKIAIDEEIIMLDQSPMYLQELGMNSKADYFREGQLLVTGKYGCLRGNEKKHNLVGVGMEFTN